MAAVVAVLVLLGGLLMVFLPLIEERSDEVAAAAEHDFDALRRERDRIVAALREVDMDLMMGKLSEEDHGALRAGLEQRAVAVLRALDEPAEQSEAPAAGPEGGA